MLKFRQIEIDRIIIIIIKIKFIYCKIYIYRIPNSLKRAQQKDINYHSGNLDRWIVESPYKAH